MVKATPPLVPLAVATPISNEPDTGFAAIEKVAVICVALMTLTFDITMSELAELTDAPEAKLKPVSVTEGLVPAEALFGLSEAI